MIISINRAFLPARNFSDPLKIMLGQLKGWKIPPTKMVDLPKYQRQLIWQVFDDY